MKSTAHIFGLVVLLFVVGCDSEAKKTAGDASAKPSASGAKTIETPKSAVAEAEDVCANYVKALEECIAKQQGDGKQAFQKELDAHNEAWKDASAPQKTQMQDGCGLGIASLKQNCP